MKTRIRLLTESEKRSLNERDLFKRLITEVYPNGIVSLVSDTFDLWNVLTTILPSLKSEVLARDGKVVIRPDCYDDQTEIFTNRGWVTFKDLKQTDLVAAVDSNLQFKFEKPTKYVNEEFSGEMVHFKDSKGKFDLLVTPNHRMVLSKNGKVMVQEADQLKVGSYTKKFFRSASAATTTVTYENSLTPLDRLRIAFQADGSFITNSTNIRFSFAKQRKIDRLLTILKECGLNYKIWKLEKNKKFPNHSNRYEIHIKNGDIVFNKNLLEFDTSEIYSQQFAQDFLEEASYWDATRRSDTRFKFDTTNYSISVLLEHMAMCAGYGCKRTLTKDDRSLKFSDVHTLHIMKDNTIGSQALTKTIEQYEGRIYCVQVSTGMLLVRRNGAVAVSGNSGDPVKIICGDPDAPEGSPQRAGVVRLLWDTFGGTVTSTGHKVLDSHVGAIYGDSITMERCEQICRNLAANGFASQNIVFGVGSYTYQHNTRDTIGAAMKATNVVVNGEERAIFKDPVTDDGVKKSARGLLRVENGVLYDNQTREQEATGDLKTIWVDGKWVQATSLDEIRARIRGAL